MKEISRDLYQELGVSSSKAGVHEATKNLSKGLFPGAFCKIVPVPSVFEDNGKYVQVMHSDGAGTKSNVAYLMKKEGYTDYLSLFASLAQDVIVMNLDDMAAVGILNDIYISNHIGRNANRISDQDIAAVISGYQTFFSLMSRFGINIIESGGETADVGSYITTIGLDAVTMGIMKKENVIDCANIRPGQPIIGLSSSGKCIYENRYNSGIRSNGLTLAINCMLSSKYKKYTEAWDSSLDESQVYRGPYKLEDKLDNTSLTIGEALLSPTRTYLPIIKEVLSVPNIQIKGIIHCSGGGATKCMKFGQGIRYVKEDILRVPPLFEAIQDTEHIDDKNMFKTFNMGTGLEIIAGNQTDAHSIITIANAYGVDAKIIGYTEKSSDPFRNEVILVNHHNTLEFSE